MSPIRGWLLAGVLGLGVAVGLGGGWMLWRPKAPKPETPKQEVRQKDGSLELARKPMGEKTARAEIPHAPAIPPGAKLERLGKVVVLPKVPPIPTAGPGIPGSGAVAPDAPKPIEVDWALVKEKDGGRRVIGSSPDGTIVGGVDIPIGPPVPEPKRLKWAAGLDYTINPWGNVKSMVVQRELGPVVIAGHVGVETITPPGGGMLRGPAVGVTAIIRF